MIACQNYKRKDRMALTLLSNYFLSQAMWQKGVCTLFHNRFPIIEHLCTQGTERNGSSARYSRQSEKGGGGPTHH